MVKDNMADWEWILQELEDGEATSGDSVDKVVRLGYNLGHSQEERLKQNRWLSLWGRGAEV